MELLDHEEQQKEQPKKKSLWLTVINILVALLVLYYLSRRLMDYIRYGQLKDGLWSIVIILPIAFLFTELWRLWNKK